MINSQKNPRFRQIKNMLNQIPGSNFKKLFLYGVPVLSAILVVAVIATSFLTQPDQSEAVFGRVERETDKETSIDSLEEIEPQIIEKDLAQVNREIALESLQDLIEEGTGVEIKEEETLSISEIQAKIKSERNLETSKRETEAAEVVEDDSYLVESAAVETEKESKPAQQSEENEESGETESNSQSEEIVYHPEGSWIDKYINISVLNVRSRPSFDAEVIGTLEQGDIVREKSIAYDLWSEVVLNDGSEGYVYNYYLTTEYIAPMEEIVPEETIEESAFTEISGTMYIGVGAANLRAAANTNSAISATLYYGAPVYLSAYSGNWYKLSDNNGNTGYIREDLLRNEPVSDEELEALEDVVNPPQPTEPEPTPEPAPVPEEPVAPGNSGGAAAASIATAQVGKPYVYGGAGPNSFDCSGLVQYAVLNAGGSISRSTYSQVNDGIAVSFSNGDYSYLAPGDVLLFAFSGGGVSHAGMYVGGGQFVHAMNPSDGIQVNSLYGYWGNTLAYVRRVFY